MFRLSGAAPGGNSAPTIVATVFAFISGYLAIAWLLRYVRSHNFTVFVVFRIAMGTVVTGSLSSRRP